MTQPPNTRPVLPGEDVKSVSLREFEQRNEQWKQDLAHERELRETISEKLEEALKLNATEIFRRLEELNHAHQTAMENWARSLPRELFDQWEKEYDRWKEVVTARLTTMSPLPEQIASLATRVTALERSGLERRGLATEVPLLNTRLSAIEKLVSRGTGAVILLGLMGVAGVIAFVMSLGRLAGIVK